VSNSARQGERPPKSGAPRERPRVPRHRANRSRP